MRTLTTIASFFLLATAPLAQSEVFVPPLYQSLDAPSLGRFAGFTQRSRQQILVDSRYLSVVQNRTLTSLTLRRDGSYRGELGAGAVDLTLFVSETSVDPGQARTLLA